MSHSPSKYSASRRSSATTSWDPVAEWYSGWVGKRGSDYHRKVAIPTVLRLAQLRHDESLLDVGCGQGVLAPHVLRAGVGYTGVDVSRRLLGIARKFHSPKATFAVGDSRDLLAVEGVSPVAFDVAVFMLSLQDMNPLESVISSVAQVLKPNGRIVIFMTHPCFRVPRGSGWGFDPNRKLTFRRVDRYLSEVGVPMKDYRDVTPHSRGSTRSFHRPLATYINTLSANGLAVDQLDEIADPLAHDEARSSQVEIPLFAALRARKHLTEKPV